MVYARLTQLEAVNQILSACGQRPVSTLEAASSAWARLAINMLGTVTRQIQSEGWDFNQEPEHTLSVDISTGKIPVPANVTRFDVYDEPNIVLRGGFLYDRQTASYAMSSAKTGHAVFLLDWDELPEEARAFITARAARRLYDQHVGSRSPTRESLFADEQRAERALIEKDSDDADYSMFDVGIPPLHSSEYIPITPRGGQDIRPRSK